MCSCFHAFSSRYGAFFQRAAVQHFRGYRHVRWLSSGNRAFVWHRWSHPYCRPCPRPFATLLQLGKGTRESFHPAQLNSDEFSLLRVVGGIPLEIASIIIFRSTQIPNQQTLVVLSMCETESAPTIDPRIYRVSRSQPPYKPPLGNCRQQPQIRLRSGNQSSRTPDKADAYSRVMQTSLPLNQQTANVQATNSCQRLISPHGFAVNTDQHGRRTRETSPFLKQAESRGNRRLHETRSIWAATGRHFAIQRMRLASRPAMSKDRR